MLRYFFFEPLQKECLIVISLAKAIRLKLFIGILEEKTRSNKWSPRFVKQGVLCPVLFWINGERFYSELDAYWRKTTPSAN